MSLLMSSFVEGVDLGPSAAVMSAATASRDFQVRDTLSTRLASAEEVKVFSHRRPPAVQIATTALWDKDGEVIDIGFVVR